MGSMNAPSRQLSSEDLERLESMRWERDIQAMVTEVLRGTHVKPVYIEFRLVHPWLRRMGFGHHENRQLSLALKEGDNIKQEKQQELDKRLLEWAYAQVPALVVNPVQIRTAGWRDKMNGYLQDHGVRQKRRTTPVSSSPLPQT